MNTNFKDLADNTQYGFTISSSNNNKHLIQYGNITSGAGSSGTITFGTPYTKFVQVIITGVSNRKNANYADEIYPNSKTLTNFEYWKVLYEADSVQWLAIGY